jgi:hypothetical protein
VRKISPHWDSIPGPSSLQRVAIATELSRLPLYQDTSIKYIKEELKVVTLLKIIDAPIQPLLYKILVGKHREKAIFSDLYYGDYTEEIRVTGSAYVYCIKETHSGVQQNAFVNMTMNPQIS